MVEQRSAVCEKFLSAPLVVGDGGQPLKRDQTASSVRARGQLFALVNYPVNRVSKAAHWRASRVRVCVCGSLLVSAACVHVRHVSVSDRPTREAYVRTTASESQENLHVSLNYVCKCDGRLVDAISRSQV